MKILVGNISTGAEYMLNAYIQKYAQGAEIVPLGAVGIKGRVKRETPNPQVLLVILDTTAYQECASVESLKSILDNPKVHKYTDEDSFKQFLISKFGVLDDSDVSNGVSSAGLGNNAIADDDDFSIGMTDTSSDTAKEAEIESLRDELAQQQMLVRNLTLQLKETENDSSISDLVEEINTLRGTIAEKEAIISGKEEVIADLEAEAKKSEQTFEKMDSLKVSLREAKELNASLEFDKTQLGESITAKDNELAGLRKELEEGVAKISELEGELQASSEKLVDMEARLTASTSESGVLEGKLKDLQALRSSFDEANEKLSAKVLECENLGVDLKNASDEIEKFKAVIEELNASIKGYEDDIASKDEQLSNLRQSGETSSAEVESLTSQVAELTASLDETRKSLETKQSEYAELEAKLETSSADYESTIVTLRDDVEKLEYKDSEIALVKADLDASKETVGHLNDKIVELQKVIAENEKAIEGVSNEKTLVEDELSVKSKLVDEVIGEKNALEEKIAAFELEAGDLNKNINDLSTAVKEKDSTIKEKDDEISGLYNELEKVKNQVKKLTEELREKEIAETERENLETELFETKRQLVKIQAELDVLKKAEDNSGAVKKYKERIAELEDKVSSLESVQNDDLSKEVEDLRSRCTDLELDLADRDAQIAELGNSIFTQLANIAMPKVAYDVKLPNIAGTCNNMYCFAGGSMESSVQLYQVIRNACEKNPSKSYLILDVVTDSSIDIQFGVSRVVSPVDWLNGSEPATNFLSDTRFPNVKVLSTALAYLNDMYLLGVDWNKRFAELSSLADIVIINVGCLVNLVTKVLFSTFSSMMHTYVVVKATPVNLRTVILSLTGFNSLSSGVEVVCVNFDVKASKVMYQKLTKKYRAQILKDGDALELKGGVN